MRRTATLLLGSTVLLCGASPALAAAGDPLTGYWSRTRTGLPVPVQPPDPVPEGGTWVSGDPSGPVAVSALRADLAAGLVGVELRLTIADSLGAPAVQSCPSTDRWVPEQGGRLEAAPQADCSAPLDAEVDGDVLVVPLPSGLDAVNVLLRPRPGSTFSLTLERATAASVVTAPAPSAMPPTAPAPFLPPPQQGSAPPPVLGDPVLTAFTPPAPVAQEPLLATPALPQAAAPAPAPAPQAAPAPVALPLASPRALPAAADRDEELLAAAVLAAVGAQALRLARQPATAPRALGGVARRSRPVADPAALQVLVPARGVGRFRREAVLGVRTADRGVGRFRTARARPPVRI